MAGSPHSHDSQAGRAATEAVTRLLMPRVLRVPRRRPQVKARNWGRGAQVTVGKGKATTQDQGRDGLWASQWGQPLGLGRGLPWGGGWVRRRSEPGACPSTPLPWALPPDTAGLSPSGRAGGSCCPVGRRCPEDRGEAVGSGSGERGARTLAGCSPQNHVALTSVAQWLVSSPAPKGQFRAHT